MKIIVLTGGPRAGKTTVLNYLKKALPAEGVYPIFVPELATAVFSSGIEFPPIAHNPYSNRLFQTVMIKSQMQQEDVYRQIADIYAFATKKIPVLICDRGVIDNFAYIEPVEREWIIQSLGLDYKQLAGRYSAVIHMKTSGYSPEYEVLKNDNPIRHEQTAADAIEADTKTFALWISSTPNVTIVPYYDDFELKCKQVKDIILKGVKG
jgi:predicted ATPase